MNCSPSSVVIELRVFELANRRHIAPTRFGGVGAWRVRSNSAVFWSAQPTIGIHGNSNAVVFPEISVDWFFDHTSQKLGSD